ncbi:MAG: hypothetical protein JSU95_08170 [Betaproteobacteria bacterium]|nr:MAG: hypothetical protein JSU95_08170 [Betaproteobacteria bacterium]
MNLLSYKLHQARLLTTALAVIGLLATSVAFAEGTTERERTMSRYSKCEWTDAMSKELYECIKRNNGFNTHWCFDETLQTNCEPEPLAAAPQSGAQQNKATQAAAQQNTVTEAAVEQAAAEADQPLTHEEARERASRQGEENLVGTIEREQTMLKYKDCEWTDEMGKYTYECVVRNGGFGTHWCYDEALQLHCPQPEAEPKS